MEEDGRLTKKAQKKLKRKGKTDNRIDSLLGKLKFNGDP